MRRLTLVMVEEVIFTHKGHRPCLHSEDQHRQQHSSTSYFPSIHLFVNRQPTFLYKRTIRASLHSFQHNFNHLPARCSSSPNSLCRPSSWALWQLPSRSARRPSTPCSASCLASSQEWLAASWTSVSFTLHFGILSAKI
jgi:hypothetical protein